MCQIFNQIIGFFQPDVESYEAMFLVRSIKFFGTEPGAFGHNE